MSSTRLPNAFGRELTRAAAGEGKLSLPPADDRACDTYLLLAMDAPTKS
jgi:hypothetical protein